MGSTTRRRARPVDRVPVETPKIKRVLKNLWSVNIREPNHITEYVVTIAPMLVITNTGNQYLETMTRDMAAMALVTIISTENPDILFKVRLSTICCDPVFFNTCFIRSPISAANIKLSPQKVAASCSPAFPAKERR